MHENHLLEPIKHIVELAVAPLSEYQLMKALEAQGWLAPVNSADSLALYGAHFLIYNALYQLHKTYLLDGEYYLAISALSIELQPVKSESTRSSSVSSPSDCQSEMVGLAKYYLDWRNLDSATQSSVDQLLEGFWLQYVDVDDYQKALQVLQLEGETSFDAMKKRYRELLMRHHPDRGGESAVFCEIHDAFSVIQRYHRT